ncbi:AEC family transporter [Isoptericola sp. NPDC019693]|uniref:AEC family transporter n=1 Tax=Isoptericola sp. NPDC019693 TaxID=3364009 RepID=UPI003789233D
MSGVLLGFAVVLVLVGVGWAVTWLLPARAPEMQRGIAPLVYYVTNPALMFVLVSRSDPAAVLGTYAPLALVVAAATGLLFAVVAGGLLRRPAGTVATGAMASSYVNAGNIGVPVALYAVGSTAPVVSVLLAQLLVVAPAYLAVFAWCRHRADRGAGGDGDGLGRMLGRALANPVTVSTAVGLLAALLSAELPEVLDVPLGMLADASVPLLLLLFGMSLRGRARGDGGTDRAAVAVGTALKVAVMPALAWAAGRFLFHLDGTDLLGVVIMAALPTAQNVFLFAGHFRLSTAVVRDVSLASLVLALPVSVGIAVVLG